jgi:hypothetical protein
VFVPRAGAPLAEGWPTERLVFDAPVDPAAVPAEARLLAEVQTFAARADDSSLELGVRPSTTTIVTRRRSLPSGVRAVIR